MLSIELAVTTPAFLDLLAARRLHATFFLLGSMVARAPQLAAEIAAAGHEIAVHGWDHRYTILRGPGAVFSDLARASDAVSGATGTSPRFFRPPYGVLSSGAVLAARRLELTPVLWSSWGREWAPGATPDSVFAAVVADLTGGATILLHDSDCTSPAGAASAALGARLWGEARHHLGLAAAPHETSPGSSFSEPSASGPSTPPTAALC